MVGFRITKSKNHRADWCVACHKIVEVGEGVWGRAHGWRKSGNAMHLPGRCARPGWVYAIAHAGPDRDLIKVGKTKNPMARVGTLRAIAWSVPERFEETIWAAEVPDAHYSERKVLAEMAPVRAFLARPETCPFFWTELFRCDLQTALNAISANCGSQLRAFSRVEPVVAETLAPSLKWLVMR